MGKRRFLLALVIWMTAISTICFFSQVLAAGKDKPITLKMAVFHPPTAPCCKIWHSYEPKFKELTHGRVMLKVYDSGTLVKPPHHFQAIQRGVVDLAFSFLPFVAKTVPMADIGSQITLWRDYKGFDEAMDNGVMKIIEEDFAAHGFENLSIQSVLANGPFYILTRKPVKVPSDLVGMKIAAPGQTYINFIKACGGTPAFSQVTAHYEDLQRGIIDGVHATAGNMHDMKWPEVAPYAVDFPLGQTIMACIANKKSLAGIPDDVRPLVIELLKSCMTKIAYTRHSNNTYYRDTFLEKYRGTIFYVPTKEQEELWRKTGLKTLDSWIKQAGERGKKAVAIIEKYNQR
jgi:C4-dicarboxylate-binding protein DctP